MAEVRVWLRWPYHLLEGEGGGQCVPPLFDLMFMPLLQEWIPHDSFPSHPFMKKRWPKALNDCRSGPCCPAVFPPKIVIRVVSCLKRFEAGQVCGATTTTTTRFSR